MASWGQSTQQRANRRRQHYRADGERGEKRPQDQIQAASAHSSAVWGEQEAHLRCGGKLHQAEAA